MVLLHPNILEKDGKKEFAVLTFEEFLKIQDELQDYEDLKDLREAISKEKESPTFTLSQAKKELNI